MGSVGGNLYPESLSGPLFPLQLWFTGANSASMVTPGPFSISLLYAGLLCLESFSFSLQYVKLCSLLCGEVALSPSEIHSGIVGILPDCAAFPNRCSTCARQAEEVFPFNKEDEGQCQGLGCTAVFTEEHAGNLSILVSSVTHVMGRASGAPSARGKGSPLVSSPTSLLEQEYHKGVNLLVMSLSGIHKQSNKQRSMAPCWSPMLHRLRGRCARSSTTNTPALFPRGKPQPKVFGAGHFLFRASLHTQKSC